MEGERSCHVSESTPHFLRCSWCAKYFDAAQNCAAPGSSKPCCPACAQLLQDNSSISGSAFADDQGRQVADDLGRSDEPSPVVRLRRDAADGQGEAVKWQRCPICHQVIRSEFLQVAPGANSSAIEIHLRHTRAEQKQHLRNREQSLSYVLSLPERGSDANSGEQHRQAQQRKRQTKNLVEHFSLKSWYPDSMDCSVLFWYNYALR